MKYWLLPILLLFMASASVVAQQGGLQFSAEQPVLNFNPFQQISRKTALPYSLTSLFPQENFGTRPVTSMPTIYCIDQMAFFCSIEAKLEKSTKFPVKFRLGDVDYVDWLEGK